VAVDREKCWQQDLEIAKRYNIMHYAETGGPGAFAHTARNIAIIMDIIKDVEMLCPDAWLLDFTNPVTRICTAAARYSNVKTVGICHQLMYAYMMVGVILAKELGVDAPASYRFEFDSAATYFSLVEAGMEKVEILAAGINHFTWVLGVRNRASGEDLYPLLMERFKTHYPRFEPLTRETADIFGVFPAAGDCHLCEFLPYTHNMFRKVWDRYDVEMYPLDRGEQRRAAMWDRIKRMASGEEPLDGLGTAYSERVEHVIAAMLKKGESYEPALNIPNRGYITNLPENAIVEVPAIVSASGIRGVNVGALPEPVAELCRRQITITELAVDAAVKGDRKLALQALALDPMVDDLDVARRLLDDYLETFKDYLPQFR
jgi:alpha-galactosidase